MCVTGSDFHKYPAVWYNGGVVHISVGHRWTLDANLRRVRGHLSFKGPVGSGAEQGNTGMTSQVKNSWEEAQDSWS